MITKGLMVAYRLGTSIDNMVFDELERSRAQLVAANAQLDQRREFTETVHVVSSGVIGLMQRHYYSR